MSLHLLADLEENHRRFIQRSILNKSVWLIIQSETGQPLMFPSHADPAIFIIPAWSDKAYAAFHCKNELASDGYEPISIDLFHFINHDLYSFYKEGILIGTNWNADMAGLENNPIHLSEILVKEMLKQAQPSNLQNLEECHALIYRLSQSLAYHVIETEFNLSLAPETSQRYIASEIVKAKVLIEESGWDIDELYPPSERPVK